MKEKNRTKQEALEESQLRYHKIFHSLQEGIFLFDASDGQIIDANQFFLDLFEYSLSELLTKKIADLGLSPVTIPIPEIASEASKAAPACYRNIPLKTKEGRGIAMDIFCTGYLIGGKKIVQCVVHNAAGRKLAEANLKQLTEDLQAKENELAAAEKSLRKLDELKSEFVSVVSHELRTPLATMREFSNIILDEIAGALNKEQKQYMDIIKENIDRLDRLIGNLLDMSSLDAGKIEIKKTFIDLSEPLAGVLSRFKPQAEGKQIELITRIPASGVHVCADPDRISQIFHQLIENAIRYMEKAGQLTVEIKEKEDCVECAVADTGIGIAEKDLDKVFSKFQQFGRVHGDGEKGTGLGLSIVKNIIERHQGRIWVESKEGEGTKFIFTLPKYPAEALFKEYVHSAMLELHKAGPQRALIVVSLINFDKVRQELPRENRQMLLKEMESVLKRSIQGEGELVIKDTGKVLVVLANYDVKYALTVKTKLWQALEDYLTRQDLSRRIILRFGDTYPEEARNEAG